MEVINKPDTLNDEQPGHNNNGITPPPPNDPPKTDKNDKFPHPKKSLPALILGRAVFVIVGAMFIIMCIFSVLELIVTSNQPYLVPNVVDQSLHQDAAYLQIEGENYFREIVVIRDRPADPEDREVTQIPVGKNFRLIFTPKLASAPEEYRLVYRDGPAAGDNKTLESQLERKANHDKEGSFDVITVTAKDGKWPAGRFLITWPDAGMFGGTLFAYLNVTDSK